MIQTTLKPLRQNRTQVSNAEPGHIQASLISLQLQPFNHQRWTLGRQPLEEEEEEEISIQSGLISLQLRPFNHVHQRWTLGRRGRRRRRRDFPNSLHSPPLRRNLMGMFPMVDGDGTFLRCGDWKNLPVLIGSAVVVSWVRLVQF
jgi:hypothetical protein